MPRLGKCFRVAAHSNVTLIMVGSSECQAILQGHTSLVGQLQMRGGTLVTGGSDGSVRVWSLERFCAIHRLAAHDNSVTSLQFDDTRVVSGGSDGRVKVWDLKTGNLVRELVTQGEAVWRVAFEEEKCVAMALKNSRTVMEVSLQSIQIFSTFLLVHQLLTRIIRCGPSLPQKRCSATSAPPCCLLNEGLMGLPQIVR